MRTRIFTVMYAIGLRGAIHAQPPLTFSSSQLAVDSGTSQVVTADFNGDGNADLAFLSNQRITMLLGKGDGTFAAPIVVQASGYSSIVTGDFNRDGKIDIVAFGTSIDTFLGHGDGTFAPPVSTSNPAGVANWTGARFKIADMNVDGVPDLVTKGYIFLGARDGTFPTFTMFGPQGVGGLTDFAIADFNGDGVPDLATSEAALLGDETFGFYVTSVEIRFGKGDGTFMRGSSAPSLGHTNDTYYSLVAGDFNGDGVADLLVFDDNGRFHQPQTFSMFAEMGGSGSSFRASSQTMNFQFFQPAIVDMNGDNRSDLVAIAGTGISIWLSNGDGAFSSGGNLFVPPLNKTPVSFAVADFNHDGRLDVVVAFDNNATVLLNTTFRVNSVLNAAAFTSPIAPGSLVAIFGAGIGPPTPIAAPSGSLPKSLGGVSVTFNGIPAPLSYVSTSQINAQVPWSITGNASVVVNANGSLTAPVNVATAAVAPGIFAFASGQAVAVNLDGSVAGPSGHPASAGDILIVYANGLGPVSPPIDDGVAPSDGSRVAATPQVLIGGIPAEVKFAGLAPLFVGVNQLNVVVPAGVSPGIAPLQIKTGTIVTTSTVTIALR